MSEVYLAFDVGGTTIKYALINRELQIIEKGKVPTEHNKDEHILHELLRLAKKYQPEYDLQAIGVSTAGIVGDDGSILYAGPTIPGYQGTPLQEALQNETLLPVFVVNDVDAALLGEKVAGVAKDISTAYCIALGTGIGGAYFHHGRLISGAHSFANSIGYTLYHRDSNTYYEQRASTLALERKLAQDGINVIDAFAEAKNGNSKYLNIIKEWVYQVATGIAEVILLFDPEVMIIGGAVSQQGDFLLDLINDALKQLIPDGLFKTKLKMAQLSEKAQLFGAISNFL